MEAVQRMVVLPYEPIAPISPYLHGHFSEHLGIYVGPDAAIPNTNGIRHDVVAALRPLHLPVLRWPGGCFADDYHWGDGIDPQQCLPHPGPTSRVTRYSAKPLQNRFVRSLLQSVI